MTTEPAAGPLDGIRVIDLTAVLMGPLATRVLGDLGAEVILVETLKGDRNRTMGLGPHKELSGISLNLLRNKRSVSLDLKSDRGRQAFLDIVATCDVMITNQRPAPLARLGLDLDAVRAVRPDIVFCQAHGYPSDSPLGEAPAYDDIIQSASGLSDLFTLMGEEPRLLPTLVADKVCGMAIANAVLAALFHRARTGEGQHIEVPMIDVMRSFVLAEHGAGAIPEPPVAPAGYPRILTPERRPQATADGWINILPYEIQHFVDLYAAAGRDDDLDHDLIKTRRTSTETSDAIYKGIAALLPLKTTAEWLTICSEYGIPATEATSVADLVDELPLADHPIVGSYRVIPPAERFSSTPQSVRRPAPRLGENGREVLAELGYDDQAIQSMIDDGILRQPNL